MEKTRKDAKFYSHWKRPILFYSSSKGALHLEISFLSKENVGGHTFSVSRIQGQCQAETAAWKIKQSAVNSQELLLSIIINNIFQALTSSQKSFSKWNEEWWL